MENASKALIMASSVLLGVMIISIAVYLFSTYAQYSSNIYNEIENTQITKFNQQFLKYYGTTSYTDIDDTGKETYVTETIKCTAHDIITLANLAQQNNIYYQVDGLLEYNINSFYIEIDLGKNRNTQNIEKWTNEQKTQFIKNNSTRDVEIEKDGVTKTEKQTKYYYIKEYPIISETTKRVCYIKFEEYKIP